MAILFWARGKIEAKTGRRRQDWSRDGRRDAALQRFVIPVIAIGAGAAKDFAVAAYLTAEVDAFTTGGADDTLAFVSGKFFWRKFDLHPLRGEQVVVRDFAVSEHLLLVFIPELGVHLACESLGRLFRRDANRLSGADVHEGGGDLAPVAELQGALAEAATGDDGDGVGGAAVNLHKSDQTLAVFTARIVDAQPGQAEHGQAHTQDLSGAEMAVGLFGVAEIFVEGFHSVVGRQSSARLQVSVHKPKHCSTGTARGNPGFSRSG